MKNILILAVILFAVGCSDDGPVDSITGPTPIDGSQGYKGDKGDKGEAGEDGISPVGVPMDDDQHIDYDKSETLRVCPAGYHAHNKYADDNVCRDLDGYDVDGWDYGGTVRTTDPGDPLRWVKCFRPQHYSNDPDDNGNIDDAGCTDPILGRTTNNAFEHPYYQLHNSLKDPDWLAESNHDELSDNNR